MAKFEVTLEDGRKTESYAPDEQGAAKQAEHWDRDRFVIAVKRGQEPGPSPAKAAEVRKVKD
jgi:hypothetical protein